MSITLITGVPGSGKTLYAVSKLLQPIIGSQIPVDDDEGRTVMHTRSVFTNINGLLLDHELIDANGAWEWDKDSGDWVLAGTPGGLHDWHQWAQPGAFIVFDEFQKAWPPRPNGSRIPPDVQALDTHRHMGVDFVLLTQNCLNVDRHILGLVDRHLHVRRLANSHTAIVYEWDHASRSLLYKNALNRSPFRYDKDAFKLYKSARVHTKQRRSLPGLVWFILIGFVALLFLGPAAYSRINSKTASLAPAKSASSPVVPVQAAASAPASDDDPGPLSRSRDRLASKAGELVGEVEALEVAGCAVLRDECKCYDKGGAVVDLEPDACRSKVGSVGVVDHAAELAAHRLQGPIVQPVSPADLRFYEAVHGDRERRALWGRPIVPGFTPAS